MYKINLLNDMSTAYHNYLFDLRPLMIKNFSFLLRNRQFVFAPKIEYQLVAESLLRRDKLREVNQNSLTFPIWCLYCTKLAPISKTNDVARAERVVM